VQKTKSKAQFNYDDTEPHQIKNRSDPTGKAVGGLGNRWHNTKAIYNKPITGGKKFSRLF
jgi:hypothetical protein